MRSYWVLRIGLFIYDNLSRINRLPKSKAITRARQPDYFVPLYNSFYKGFTYSDGATDDARLTIENALQAKKHGATILTQCQLEKADIINKIWSLTLHAKEKKLRTRTLVNATGPWVEKTSQLLNVFSPYQLTLVKGSHIVVNKLYEGSQAYLLQNNDKRIIFVIPWHGFSMIGTTDVAITDLNEGHSISSEETNYLLSVVRDYFKMPLSQKEVKYSWSGVRPLIAETNTSPQCLSRDYNWHFSAHPAPIVTVYGGKITTYRQLAKDVVDALQAVFPELRSSTTLSTPLPGAKIGNIPYEEYCRFAKKKYDWLEALLLRRLLQTYGTSTEAILSDCQTTSDLGQHFGHTLFQKEVDYLIQQEWAITSDDILWRRTKLGLCFSKQDIKHLNIYLARQ